MAKELIMAVIGSGVLSVIINRIFAVSDRKREKDDAIMLLLYHDIKMECKEYIAQNSIDSDSLEVLTKMHKTYHDRGGNGYLDRLMSAVNKLPITN